MMAVELAERGIRTLDGLLTHTPLAVVAFDHNDFLQQSSGSRYEYRCLLLDQFVKPFEMSRYVAGWGDNFSRASP